MANYTEAEKTLFRAIILLAYTRTTLGEGLEDIVEGIMDTIEGKEKLPPLQGGGNTYLIPGVGECVYTGD